MIKILLTIKYAIVTIITMMLSFCGNAQLDTAIVRTFGGPYYEEGRQIIECAEGGYAIIGTTGSDQLNNTNFYLLRLDEELNCLWSQNYGGAEVEWGYSIVEDANNNLLVCGYTNSYGEGGYDILVYKVDPLGNVLWQKTYGGSDWDFAYKMIAHPEEGYLICGKTYSYGNGGSDAYLLHISEDGNLIDEWTYGGEGDDEFRDLDFTNESSIILCGHTSVDGISQASVWSLGINSEEIIWQHINGDGLNNFKALSVQCTENRIYVSGERGSGDLHFGYYQYLSFDNEQTYWFSIDQSNSDSFQQIQYFDNSVTLVGYSYAFGFGAQDCLLYRFTDELHYYEGGIHYGGTADDYFSSFLIDSTKMVFTGARQNPATDAWQMLVMLYTKTVLETENNMAPENQTCFTVDIEEFYSSQNEMIKFSVYDITGRLIIEEKETSIDKLQSGLNSGLYVIVSSDFSLVKKISVR